MLLSLTRRLRPRFLPPDGTQAVFALGFSLAFFVQFRGVGVAAFLRIMQQCFGMMLGELHFGEIETRARDPWLAVVLAVSYTVLIAVMLLNLLIAMMGDTYSRIREDARLIWRLEQARIIFSIETEMTEADWAVASNQYWTEIGGQRFVQVYEVDQDHFASFDKGAAEPPPPTPPPATPLRS